MDLQLVNGYAFINSSITEAGLEKYFYQLIGFYGRQIFTQVLLVEYWNYFLRIEL